MNYVIGVYMLDIPSFSKRQTIFLHAVDGEKLSFRNDNIIISSKEDKIIHQSSCYRLFIIFIIGNTSITSVLIEKARKFSFSICLMKSSTRIVETIGYNLEGNTILKKLQYEYKSMDIAKSIIKNKIMNQRIALEKLRLKTDESKEVIDILNTHINTIDATNDNLNNLLGVEGSAARTYFPIMFDYEEWSGRKPRVKADYINATLDIGYTLLFNFIEAILKCFGFDVYQGVLHTNFYMRKSLVCDIMEPFRPMIDLQVRKSINLHQFKEDDFTMRNKKLQLDFKCSKKYTKIFLETILDNKEEIFMYIRSYYRFFVKRVSVPDMPVYILGEKYGTH